MSEPSIRKIKIPLTPSGQKLQKKPKPTQSSKTTQDSNVLVEVARYMQKRYNIIPTWKGESLELFEFCKTRSESKCVLELFNQSKKAVKKAQKSATNEPTSKTKTSKSTKSSSPKTIFKRFKRRPGSHKTIRSSFSKPEKPSTDEVSITENAQRSK